MAMSDNILADEERRGVLMRLATYAAVAVAVLLIFMKAAAYYATGSVAMLATLMDSVLDMSASLINLFAVRAALTPADAEHRFGHGKAEAMAGLVQAGIIFLSAAYIFVESGSRLVEPEPVTQTGAGILVVLVAVALTLGLVGFQRHVVKQTNSLAIAADSIHYKGDLLMNFAVLISLSLASYPALHWADPVFGILIGAFISYSAWQILRRSLDQLMDRELPDEDRDRIRTLVLSDPDVHNMHDLRTRVSGAKLFIQYHIELDGEMSLIRAHEIADRVEEAVSAAFPGAEVISHQDPEGLETITSFERG